MANEKKTWNGSCHCGAVRFTATTDLSQVIACNCSICQRSGHLLAFVGEGDFNLEQGNEVLGDYQFGKKHIHHRFCTKCGIRPFGHGVAPQGGEMYAVNVRCLEGIELEGLQVTPYDGKSL